MEHIEKLKKCRVQREIPEEDFKTQIIMTLPLSWERYAESSFATDGNINNVNITSHEMIMHIQGRATKKVERRCRKGNSLCIGKEFDEKDQ
jgi:hypothetical protein